MSFPHHDRDLGDLTAVVARRRRRDQGPRFMSIRETHLTIAPMLWGPRISIDAACASIRRWVEQRLEAT
jgi:hypothetical protein